MTSDFTPVNAVWELTMACNMRCTHCGSACATALPDELTTAEALNLCDQLAGLGLQRVTLSGGEPLLRRDWPLLATRLTTLGVSVSMISNGWLLSRAEVEAARRAGVRIIAVSIDGLEQTHDGIRKPGSYRRAIGALALMRSLDFPSAVITTIIKRNLPELPLLMDALVQQRPKVWQLQVGSAIGNLASRREEWLDPRDTPAILDFAVQVTRETSIIVDLADCLGYYTKKEQEVQKARGDEDVVWAGCPAGKHTLGVRHNGDISGCNAIRDATAIEGNVREAPLKWFWTRPGAFSWNRERTTESLTGTCRLCQFSAVCLAGCTSVRRGLGGSDGEYAYCAYRLELEQLCEKVDRTRDPDALVSRAERAVGLGLPDVAHRCLTRALALDPGHRPAAVKLVEVTSRLSLAEARVPSPDQPRVPNPNERGDGHHGQ